LKYDFLETEGSSKRAEACNPLKQAAGQQNWIKGSVVKYAKQARKDGCSKKEARSFLEKSFEEGWEEGEDFNDLSPEATETLKNILAACESLSETESHQLSSLRNDILESLENFFEKTYIDPEDLSEATGKKTSQEGDKDE
jgi:flagellar biosynthesis/type III secretory pathway protein FliH